MTQYINEQELNSVKGLIHYLNDNIPSIEGLTVEARITDHNGEEIGVVKVPEGSDAIGSGYALHFPAHA